jgi:hypothetical protein
LAELTAYATRFVRDDAAANERAAQRIFDFEERVREGRKVAAGKLDEIRATRYREEKEQEAAFEKMTQAPNMALIMQMGQAAQRIPALSSEMQATGQRISDATVRMGQEHAHILAEQKALLNKAPYDEIQRLKGKASRAAADLAPAEAREALALWHKLVALTEAYYAQILPEWHAHMVNWHATVRGQKADLERLEAIEFEIQQAATGQKKAGSIPLGLEPDWQSVVEQLDVLRKITEFQKP